MAGARDIKAGGAYVEISADRQKLNTELAKAEQNVKTFAGSVNQFGSQAMGKFGGAITKGLVGFVAVDFIDRTLKNLATSLEAAAAGADFKGVGTIIGESIQEGFQSIPIFGSLEKLAELGFGNALWGVDAGAEGRMKQGREEAAKRNAAFGAFGDAKAAILEKMAGEKDPLSKARAEFEGQARKLAADLAASGATQDQVREQVDELRKAFKQLEAQLGKEAFARAAKEADLVSASYMDLARSLDENAQFAAKLEEDMNKVRAAFNGAGLSGFAETFAQALKDRALWARDEMKRQEAEKKASEEATRQAESIQGVLDGLQKQAEDANLSPEEQTIRDLERMGASPEQIQQAKDLLEQKRQLELMQDPSNSYLVPPAPLEQSLQASGSFSNAVFARWGGATSIAKDPAENIAKIAKSVSDIQRGVYRATSFGH